MASPDQLTNSTSYGSKLTTTAATAVYTRPTTIRAKTRISTMWICNTDSVARSFTLEWYDVSAGVSFRILKSYVLAPNIAVSVEFPSLWIDKGDEIRVTAGTANTLEVIVTAETYGGGST